MKVKRNRNGYTIPIKVGAGASADRLQGEYGGRLKLSVSAPAEKGKANEAVCELLAERTGVRPSDVRIVSGQTCPEKEVFIRGVDKDALRKLLD